MTNGPSNLENFFKALTSDQTSLKMLHLSRGRRAWAWTRRPRYKL